MIVVEGPDGTGKTTLAHTLAEQTGREYRRAPISSTKGPATDVVEYWREELWADQSHAIAGIYDRTYLISEPIYTSVMNRKPLTQPEEFAGMLERFLSHHPLIIFCMPPWSEQKKHLEESTDGLEGLTLERAVIVLWDYYVWLEVYRLFEKLGKCRVQVYYWDNFPEISMAVSQYLNEEANTLGSRS